MKHVIHVSFCADQHCVVKPVSRYFNKHLDIKVDRTSQHKSGYTDEQAFEKLSPVIRILFDLLIEDFLKVAPTEMGDQAARKDPCQTLIKSVSSSIDAAENH